MMYVQSDKPSPMKRGWRNMPQNNLIDDRSFQA